MPHSGNFADQLKLQLPSWMNSVQLTGFSKDFFELVRDIGEAKSKEEEERIIKSEAQRLKTAMAQPDQNGLISTNYLEICSALIALCKLINADTIPAFLPTVVGLLTHNKAAVRKKAVMAIHRFWLKSPETVSHLNDKLRIVLCDRDPSVMAASLCLFLDVARTHGHEFKDLIPSFVSILKQVAENRLPRSYEYHLVPAPWIQINLLKLLGIFGANDQAASEHMYEVLQQVMQRAQRQKSNAGFAVLYECIRTVISIKSSPDLLEAAASSISEFLTLRNHNLKYLGIKALASVVKIAPRFVAPHQLDIIECLESTDESLKRKTLDLLYRMTNTKNVVATTTKLIEYLRHTVATDEHVRAELVSRITELAERYAPTNQWYVDTISVMLHLGGALIRPEVAYNLVRLIAQGSGESEEADNTLRKYAVTTFLNSLKTGGSVLPDIEVNVICWVIGEYAYLAESDQAPGVLDTAVTQTLDLMERHYEDPVTRGWVLTALLKLVAQLPTCPHQVVSLIDKYSRSRHVDSQLRANEFRALVRNPQVMEEVLPIDASCEDIEVDTNLPFLDGFVQEALAAGASPYLPANQRRSAQSLVKSYESAAASGGKKDWNFSYPAPIAPTTQAPILPPSSFLAPLPISSASNGFTPTAPSLLVSTSVPSQSANLSSAGTHTSPKTVSAQNNSNFTLPSGTPAFSSPYKNPTATPPKKLNENQQQLFEGLSVGNDDSTTQRGINIENRRTKSPPKHDTVSKPTTRQSTSTPITPTTPTAPATPAIAPATDLLIDFLGELTPSSTPTKNTPSQSPRSTSPTSSTPPITSPPIVTRPSTFATSRYQAPQVSSQASKSPSSPPKPSVLEDFLTLNIGSGIATPSTPPHSSLLDNNTMDIGPQSSDVVLAPSAPLATQVTPSDNFDLSNLSHTPLMWGLFDGSPASGPNQNLSGDANLRVSYTKAMKKEDTIVVLLLSNANASALTDVIMEVKVPEHFAVVNSADNVVRVNINSNTHTFTVSNIGSHITIVVAMKLRHRKHGFNLALTGNVKYRGPAANALAKGKEISLSGWQIPIEINDLLRPLTINTETFGKQWTNNTRDKKVRFTPTTPFPTSATLLELLCKGLAIKLVQLIGNEGIAAGLLVNGDVCLVHASIVGLAVDITVRTKDNSFTEVVVRQLHKIIR